MIVYVVSRDDYYYGNAGDYGVVCVAETKQAAKKLARRYLIEADITIGQFIFEEESEISAHALEYYVWNERQAAYLNYTKFREKSKPCEEGGVFITEMEVMK